MLGRGWVKTRCIVLQDFFNVLKPLVFLEMTQNQDKEQSRNFSTEQSRQEDNGPIFVFSLKVQNIFFCPFGFVWYFVYVFYLIFFIIK